jgi:FAD:protein FMN transferase
MSPATEVTDAFACFGAEASVRVFGDDLGTGALEAVEGARRRLMDWHERFTRFDPASELSRLNADPRWEVPISPDMALFLRAAVAAAESTGGLVDATLLDQIVGAGYSRDIRGSLPLDIALRLTPERKVAGARWPRLWRDVAVDGDALTVRRPPGMKFDSGGIAKGLFADLLSLELSELPSYAIDCAGDLRLGGTEHIARPVHVASPFDGETVHTFELDMGGVATSGIGRRSWLDADGRPAHHLLDPATGKPAFTGVVQVTALAPTALEAETRSKAALLSGPRRAPVWLPYGGVVVHDDGSHRVLAPGQPVSARPDTRCLADTSGRSRLPAAGGSLW